jgi:hypothetical protein
MKIHLEKTRFITRTLTLHDPVRKVPEVGRLHHHYERKVA